SPQSARNDLMKQPTVDQQIERTIRGLNLQRLRERLPSRRNTGPRLIDRGDVAAASGEPFRRFARFPASQRKNKGTVFARRQHDVSDQREAWIEARADRAREFFSAQCGRRSLVPQAADEIVAIASKRTRANIEVCERPSVGEVALKDVAREQRP